MIYTETHFGLQKDFDPRDDIDELACDIEHYLERELSEQEWSDLRELREYRIDELVSDQKDREQRNNC